ncbi:EamA family transporter [Caenimonas soli]|uniref:EamA family transporter n=1 Tax=Caenimonas soli TaxID=2735555 RepID=UPI001555FE14|nr:EamA family transporter [Caenimonas soli]NPC55664.1 EamA family transporter [Caenimonas soli]
MPVIHLMLALAVVFIWGTNFVVIKWGLAEFDPFLFAALRFALCIVPWIFFIPRPAVAWSRLAWFGVLLGAGQFGLLFMAMRADVTPGLASLVMQSQVFFTIGLSMALQGERVTGPQYLALALAVAGISVIGWQSLGSGQASVTPLGLVLLLCAAACWAIANLVARRAGKVNALAFIVWSSPFSLPPLMLLALYFHGWPAMADSLAHASISGWASALWQALGNTLFGFAMWNWLLARYPAATVAPMALLVPVFGMSASAWLLGEPLQAWKLAAAALVIAGLALNFYASQRPARA